MDPGVFERATLEAVGGNHHTFMRTNGSKFVPQRLHVFPFYGVLVLLALKQRDIVKTLQPKPDRDVDDVLTVDALQRLEVLDRPVGNVDARITNQALNDLLIVDGAQVERRPLIDDDVVIHGRASRQPTRFKTCAKVLEPQLASLDEGRDIMFSPA